MNNINTGARYVPGIFDAGMVLGSTSTRFRHPCYKSMCKVALDVINELEPRHACCMGGLGWDRVWGAMLLETNVPYTLIQLWPGVGSTWSRWDIHSLDKLIDGADELVYIRDEVRDRYISEEVWLEYYNYLSNNVEALAVMMGPSNTVPNRVEQMCSTATVPVINLWDKYQEGRLSSVALGCST
jgi:hypothetical protein